jgi:nucleoside 2-deoxyribosyltransferase
MKKVYLAGPDVFWPEPEKLAGEMKRICLDAGFEAVFPLDATITFEKDELGPSKARKIFEANTALIRSCQGVLANIQPFRGPSLDVGTAWEMGYAHALGKPVVAYWCGEYDYKDKALEYLDLEEKDLKDGRDWDGVLIEDFGLSDNLMPICGSFKVFDKRSTAVEQMADLLKKEAPYRSAERDAKVAGPNDQCWIDRYEMGEPPWYGPPKEPDRICELGTRGCIIGHTMKTAT